MAPKRLNQKDSLLRQRVCLPYYIPYSPPSGAILLERNGPIVSGRAFLLLLLLCPCRSHAARIAPAMGSSCKNKPNRKITSSAALSTSRTRSMPQQVENVIVFRERGADEESPNICSIVPRIVRRKGWWQHLKQISSITTESCDSFSSGY